MSHRREQLESSLKRSLGTILAGGLNDPRITGIISVTEVAVSPDLHNATVKVSVMPENAEKRSVAGLNHAARHLQTQVGGKLRTRSVPHLRFEIDPSIKKQAAVLAAIREAMEEDEQHAAARDVNPGAEADAVPPVTDPDSGSAAAGPAEESPS
ncbi:MAG: 30S ribosome-binding factor RbfA [Phycisphaera sp.]|nr:30S ribosome-binding factor RbfA [Phycisphaera sp.]